MKHVFKERKWFSQSHVANIRGTLSLKVGHGYESKALSPSPAAACVWKGAGAVIETEGTGCICWCWKQYWERRMPLMLRSRCPWDPCAMCRWSKSIKSELRAMDWTPRKSLRTVRRGTLTGTWDGASGRWEEDSSRVWFQEVKRRGAWAVEASPPEVKEGVQ